MCKNFLKLIEKHVREHLRTQLTARKKKSFNDKFCKKILSKFQKKIRSRRKTEVIMIAMHTNQPSTFITQQSFEKATYNIRKQKRSKEIFKGVDDELNITVKAMTSPYKRFRNKNKTRLAVHDLSESYLNTTSHRHIAKTESKEREKLHTHTLQLATPRCSSASVSLEQSINI